MSGRSCYHLGCNFERGGTVVLSDAEIMTCVQRGQTALFAQLVERYQSRLLRFAVSKSGDHATAEDLVQEAFLAAFTARASYRPQFAFSTWIWTILLNLSRRRVQRERRSEQRQAQYLTTHVPSADASSVLTLLLRQETQALVQSWLDHLPEPQADAIRLRFFGELSYEEVALAMDSSVSGAKSRVRKGLVRLAEIARAE